MRPQVVQSGEAVARAGDVANKIFILQLGEVKAWEASDYGEKQVEVYDQPGMVLYKKSLVESVWPVTLRASSDVTLVLWVSKLTLQMMLDGSPEELLEKMESGGSDNWWPFR
eukprot:UN3300